MLLLSASSDPDAPRQAIRGLFVQATPLDEEQRGGAGVWIAFLARSVVDPDLAAFIRQAWDGTHDLVAGQIRPAQRSGESPASLDPNREGVVLASLLDGLVSHVMVGHYSGEEALAAVDAHFDRRFG